MLDDPKLVDLLDRHGPVGYAVYIAAVEIIYADGYWAELNNQLILAIVKKIGSKWIKERTIVKEVIDYCACCGLFDRACEQQNVLTSPGIQRRYLFVKKRNSSKYDITEYCLLTADDKASLLPFENNPAENSHFPAENMDFPAGNDTKKRKEKERKEERETAPSRLSLPQQKFHDAFPERACGATVPEGFDIDGLIAAMKESQFLSSCQNLSLSWCVKNAKYILSGAYKDWEKRNLRNFEEREYTREEIYALFANNDED